MPTIRLIPVVLFATASLFVLKTAGLLESGGYTIGTMQGARAHSAGDALATSTSTHSKTPAPEVVVAQNAPTRSWAQEMLGYPDVTGSVPSKPAEKPPQPPPAAQPQATGKMPGPEQTGAPGALAIDGPAAQSAGERAVLESLQERRKQLEERARELEMREGLVKAAEMRLETRLGELKATEAQVNTAMQKKDEAEAARFKSLVTMYENMKAKDAARIFDRLEMRILLDVASEMNPRRMSDILAQMSPEAAERLTVELATRASGAGGDARGRSINPMDLPKIEGRPRG